MSDSFFFLDFYSSHFLGTVFWSDKEWRPLCERTYSRPQLHVFCGHTCSPHLHNNTAPSQVRAFDKHRWQVHRIFLTVNIADDEAELEVPSDEPQTDERCRSIERGAKLVTVMPTTYSVVLQMPRGNLETIYPRALVLAAIRRSIENNSYSEAFLACRNQRVDMNILHDHDPERFMSNIEKIVTQIKRIEHIDLLLSQLR
jgi:hypothetical protein